MGTDSGTGRDWEGRASATIVVPCYNEQHRLASDRFESFIEGRPDVRFYFVDDGSSDGTLAVLEAIGRRCGSRIVVVRHQNNAGKAEAVRSGILLALDSHPRFVGYLDADLATPLDELDRFLALMNQWTDCVMLLGARVRLLGRRIDRKAVRHYVGRAFATLASLKLGIPVYDTQCGIKLFRVDGQTRKLFSRPFRSVWAFDVELLNRALEIYCPEGYEEGSTVFREVPLMTWTDVGRSKVGLLDGIRAFVDVLRI